LNTNVDVSKLTGVPPMPVSGEEVIVTLKDKWNIHRSAASAIYCLSQFIISLIFPFT